MRSIVLLMAMSLSMLSSCLYKADPCTDTGACTDTESDADADADADADPPPSYATDIHPLWANNSAASCTGCHGSNGGLALDGNATATLNSLLNSVVTPGNAATSKLYKKLEGTTAGTQMPKNSNNVFSQAELSLVEDWIAAGALP